MCFQQQLVSVFALGIALTLMVCFPVLFVGPTAAEAGLLLDPTRVILDNHTSAATVTVINQDDSPANYRISLTLYRYRPDGGMEEVTHPSQAQDQIKQLVRFSPRQTLVPARGRQTIRLQFRKPSGLADAEYRVHLKFAPVPSAPPAPDAGSEEQLNREVKINLLVGISIPIIIRNGDLWAKAHPVSCKKIISGQTGKPALNIGIEREGTRSVIMDIKAYHVSGTKPDGDVLIGETRSAVIYTQFTRKTFELPIDETVLPRIQDGTVRIDILDHEKQIKRGKTVELFGSVTFDSVSVFSD